MNVAFRLDDEYNATVEFAATCPDCGEDICLADARPEKLHDRIIIEVQCGCATGHIQFVGKEYVPPCEHPVDGKQGDCDTCTQKSHCPTIVRKN